VCDDNPQTSSRQGRETTKGFSALTLAEWKKNNEKCVGPTMSTHYYFTRWSCGAHPAFNKFAKHWSISNKNRVDGHQSTLHTEAVKKLSPRWRWKVQLMPKAIISVSFSDAFTAGESGGVVRNSMHSAHTSMYSRRVQVFRVNLGWSPASPSLRSRAHAANERCVNSPGPPRWIIYRLAATRTCTYTHAARCWMYWFIEGVSTHV
jgi:hypothetical protein